MGLTNITKAEMKVRRVEPKDRTELHAYQQCQEYFFFGPTDKSIDFGISGLGGYVSLDPDNYGFQPEYRIRINPRRISFDEEGIRLNQKAMEKYEKIILKDEAPINELLECVGAIVNDSTIYGIEEPSVDASSIESKKLYLMLQQSASSLIKKSGYKPTGEEVQVGICADAGFQIRTILYSLNLASPIKFSYCNRSPDHDTTLVFDMMTGRFALINSKSPRFEFNLASKDDLEKLGITKEQFISDMEYEQKMKKDRLGTSMYNKRPQKLRHS